MADESLIDLAVAVADGAPIDWASATQTLGTEDELRLLDGLRLIADVTSARGVALPPPPAAARSAAAPHLSEGSGVGRSVGLEEWGPLRIIEQVGRGTFGDVYRAWDTRLDREVALKILRRHESSSDSTTVIEEGRLLARIRHPNVVTVYGAERINGRVGVWMEFVHGSTLEDELREHGPFDVDRLILIALELGDALAAVHRAGLLHRDVKTHNVMRDRDGRLLLTDFGSGELLESGLAASAVGTPLFAAPEIVGGQPATRQSDIYSLGVLLFRLATGRYPVEGRTLEEVRAAHASGTSSLTALGAPEPARRGRHGDRACDRSVSGPPLRECRSAVRGVLDAGRAIRNPAGAAHGLCERALPARPARRDRRRDVARRVWRRDGDALATRPFAVDRRPAIEKSRLRPQQQRFRRRPDR